MAALPTSAPAARREAAPGLRRSAWLALVLLVLSAVLLLVGASVGSTGWESVLRMRDDPTSWQIVVDIRLPRSLGAWFAGGLLGLAAPHLVRSLVQVGHGRSTVLAAAMGGVLLLAADILARWLVAPQELPVGVLTAALGGTYLLWRMHRSTRSAGGL